MSGRYLGAIEAFKGDLFGLIGILIEVVIAIIG
jgi:hypothetical protein